mmetsp:Transcript_21558/g.44483  ORF Transcript_21558/g.44483 Transcript_21558/m.44483 type:complete len:455 (-) Transcript_21558:142-1506(-)
MPSNYNSDSDLAILASLGFDLAQSRRALRKNELDLDRTIDFLIAESIHGSNVQLEAGLKSSSTLPEISKDLSQKEWSVVGSKPTARKAKGKIASATEKIGPQLEIVPDEDEPLPVEFIASQDEKTSLQLLNDKIVAVTKKPNYSLNNGNPHKLANKSELEKSNNIKSNHRKISQRRRDPPEEATKTPSSNHIRTRPKNHFILQEKLRLHPAAAAPATEAENNDQRNDTFSEIAFNTVDRRHNNLSLESHGRQAISSQDLNLPYNEESRPVYFPVEATLVPSQPTIDAGTVYDGVCISIDECQTTRPDYPLHDANESNNNVEESENSRTSEGNERNPHPTEENEEDNLPSQRTCWLKKHPSILLVVIAFIPIGAVQKWFKSNDRNGSSNAEVVIVDSNSSDWVLNETSDYHNDKEMKEENDTTLVEEIATTMPNELFPSSQTSPLSNTANNDSLC